MNIGRFKQRFSAAQKAKRTNWETLYRDAMELFCPERENFYQSIPGEKKGRQVYTSSPYIALDKASNNLHASLTPHMKRWIHLKPGRLIPEEGQEEAKTALQTITRTLFDHIHASNFDLSASEFYKDIMIGTAAMLIQGTAKNPLIFTTVPLNELYISTGGMGVVDSVFRKYKIKASAIPDTWDDAVIDNDLQQTIDTKPEHELWVIEGTVPKRIKVVNRITGDEVEADGFGYYVCLEKNNDKFLVERDMEVSPWVVARWSVMSGEEWGRGPAIICLSDAKTLNQFIKLHMQSMDLTVHPMYTIVDDGVINISSIRIGPGKMIPVSANDGVFGPSISPLKSGGNFQAGQMEIDRLETSINSQMYTDPLGAVNLPVKTATEISIRQQELSKRIGSAYGRLQYEFIKPLINAALYQLDRLGIINMNDFRVDGQNIAIEAVSPLAQGQAQDDINNVMQYVQFALGTFGPELGIGMLKPPQIMRFMGENLNIPEDMKFTQADEANAMQAIAQMAQQQAPNVQQTV